MKQITPALLIRVAILLHDISHANNSMTMLMESGLLSVAEKELLRDAKGAFAQYHHELEIWFLGASGER